MAAPAVAAFIGSFLLKHGLKAARKKFSAEALKKGQKFNRLEKAKERSRKAAPARARAQAAKNPSKKSLKSHDGRDKFDTKSSVDPDFDSGLF